METQHTPIAVFYSCSDSPTDAPLLEQLERHLSTLQREGIITTWHKRQIAAGNVRQAELDHHLNTATLILLLVSSDFLASDYCYGTEMQQALQRYKAKEAQVIPILLRPCVWQNAPFADLEMLPSGTEPITTWSDRDAAWTDVVTRIRHILQGEPPKKRSGSEPSNPAIWTIPFARNPFFTGRENLLEQLHNYLQTQQTIVISQPQAVSGLGGIGKTQLVLEYAYRYGHEYQAVLWAQADTNQVLVASYFEIARVLNLLEKDKQEQYLVIQAVKDWLRTSQNWLLVLDNADELNIVQPFLPTRFMGHLLLTTRARAMGTVARRLEIDSLDQEIGALLLLRRAGLAGANASPNDLALAKAISKELGGLPLALDQAGSYIEETQCGLADYLHLYHIQRAFLLKRRGGLAMDHPESVATTWSLSFERIERKSQLAADLLRICAFLPPDAIPMELFTMGANHLGPYFVRIAEDPAALDEAIAVLGAYSLIRRNATEKTLSIHRLVQAVLKDALEPTMYEGWTQQVILSVREAWKTAEDLYMRNSSNGKAQKMAENVLNSLFSRLGLSTDQIWGLSEEQILETARKTYNLSGARIFSVSLGTRLINYDGLPPDFEFKVAHWLYCAAPEPGRYDQDLAWDTINSLLHRSDLSIDLTMEIADFVAGYYDFTQPDHSYGIDEETRRYAISNLVKLLERPDLSREQTKKIVQTILGLSSADASQREFANSKLNPDIVQHHPITKEPQSHNFLKTTHPEMSGNKKIDDQGSQAHKIMARNKYSSRWRKKRRNL